MAEAMAGETMLFSVIQKLDNGAKFNLSGCANIIEYRRRSDNVGHSTCNCSGSFFGTLSTIPVGPEMRLSHYG